MTDHTADTFTTDARNDTPAPQLNWKWTLAIGVVYLAGGFIAFLNPFVASLVAQSFIAAAFLVGGAIAMWLAFRNEDGTTGGRFLGFAGGLIAVVFAVAIWANPLAGLVSLTLTVASLFLALGLVRIWMGVRMDSIKGRGWMIASGVLTTLLAVFIFATLPAAALSILGLFMGVELVMAGVAHIALALSGKTPRPA